MINETIERIARLMHEEARAYSEAKRPEEKVANNRSVMCWEPWEELKPFHQERYRHVAALVLKTLGH